MYVIVGRMKKSKKADFCPHNFHGVIDIVLNAGKTFFSTIVQYYCNHVCHKLRYAQEGASCPINRFLEYMKWLQDEIVEGN